MTAREVAEAAIAQHAAQKVDEFTELVSMVMDLRPEVVLEIGTLHGGTMLAWCECATSGATLISVDMPGGPWGGGITPEREHAIRGMADDWQRLHLIAGDSHDLDVQLKVATILDARLVDFLFIDGDHSRDGVAQDFKDYAPFVRKGGLIAFHDIAAHPEVDGCDVDAFWREDIVGKYDVYEFITDGDEMGYGPWGGIGVIEWNG